MDIQAFWMALLQRLHDVFHAILAALGFAG